MVAERRVRVVEDDSDDVPEISDLRTLKTRVIEGNNTDPFAAKAKDIKVLKGTSPAFKRRVTNSLKKVRENYEHDASSTQIDDWIITGYDAFGVVQPPYNLDYLSRLYEINSAHKAAVDAKTANIVALGYKFVETPKTKRGLENIDNAKKLKRVVQALQSHKDDLSDRFESFNEEDTFTEMLVKVWKDYETTGVGYLEVGRKKDGTIGYLGHIPSKTMRMRRARDGFVQISGNKAVFFANFGAGAVGPNGKPKNVENPISSDKPNEVLYIKKYSPAHIYYGVPDIISAQQAVAGMEFANRFNLDYFENKAVPRHVIILKGAKLGVRAEQQLLEFFETKLKGQNHRSLYIPLPGDTDEGKVELKIEPVEAGIQDSSFNNYRKACLSDILMVHRVPITKVSISEQASLAIAKDADKTFKEQVCAPEQQIFEKKLNRIVKELTDAFQLDLNEMTLTDANTQSQIDERNVKNGIVVPNEIRTRDGLPAIEGGDERVNLNTKNQSQSPAAQSAQNATAVRQRDANRSANSTDNQGNARNPKGDGRTQGTA